MMLADRSDFTGYWRLVKTENFDTFLRDVGFAWTVRKVREKALSLNLIEKRLLPCVGRANGLCCRCW